MNSNGFAAVARADARVLILGTLPGQVSLQHGEYYAQRQNAFWCIMGKLFGFARELSYPARKDVLLDHGIALWDVCEAAHRPGSLDTAIRDVVPNDFVAFFKSHPSIELVCFNGSKGERLYDRHVRPKLTAGIQSIKYHKLPSTSPAHAAMRFKEKCAVWSVVLRDGARSRLPA